jgi:hypothetical protein
MIISSLIQVILLFLYPNNSGKEFGVKPDPEILHSGLKKISRQTKASSYCGKN